MRIRKGDVYAADLNPRFGTEPGKIRPVVVLQTNLLNGNHPSTLVCPITSNVEPKARVLRVHLSKGEAGLAQDSDVLVDQVRAIDNRRLKKHLGELPAVAQEQLSQNLRILLDL